MLAGARSIHPDIEYIEADISTLRLDRQLDEATPAYLIREQGDLTVHMNGHVLGISPGSPGRMCFGAMG